MCIRTHISLDISKSTTPKEWQKVYELTKRMIKHLPLVEVYEFDLFGVQMSCLRSSKERKFCGILDEYPSYGWCVCGDSLSKRCGEPYTLMRDLVCEEDYVTETVDALAGVAQRSIKNGWKNFENEYTYAEWGAEMGGYPYFTFMLAIGCAVEAMLGEKAVVHGDVYLDDCKEALEITKLFFDEPVEPPVCFSKKRLYNRICKLNLKEESKLEAFINIYKGDKNEKFGVFLKEHFDINLIEEYWRERFRCSSSYEPILKNYIEQGFSVEDLLKNGYITAHSKDVRCVIADFQEDKKICLLDVGTNDHMVMASVKEIQQYDIKEYAALLYYEDEDTIDPKLLESLYRSFRFYHSTTHEKRFDELMKKTAKDRCKYLNQQNRHLLLHYKDWKRIYRDIKTKKESFARYYPMVRVDASTRNMNDIIVAFVCNDALYNHCMEHERKQEKYIQ